MTEIDMPKNRVGTSGTLGTDLTDAPWFDAHTSLINSYLSTIIKSDSHSFTPGSHVEKTADTWGFGA